MAAPINKKYRASKTWKLKSKHHKHHHAGWVFIPYKILHHLNSQTKPVKEVLNDKVYILTNFSTNLRKSCQIKYMNRCNQYQDTITRSLISSPVQNFATEAKSQYQVAPEATMQPTLMHIYPLRVKATTAQTIQTRNSTNLRRTRRGIVHNSRARRAKPISG